MIEDTKNQCQRHHERAPTISIIIAVNIINNITSASIIAITSITASVSPTSITASTCPVFPRRRGSNTPRREKKKKNCAIDRSVNIIHTTQPGSAKTPQSSVQSPVPISPVTPPPPVRTCPVFLRGAAERLRVVRLQLRRAALLLSAQASRALQQALHGNVPRHGTPPLLLYALKMVKVAVVRQRRHP